MAEALLERAQTESSSCDQNSGSRVMQHTGVTTQERLYRDQDHPLYMAASRGQTEFVKQLIARGEDVDRETSDKQTPVWASVWNGHPETLEVLLAAGARVDPLTASGISPLMQAVICHKTACVKVLLKYQANTSLRHPGDGDDLTALGIAHERNYKDCVALLIPVTKGHPGDTRGLFPGKQTSAPRDPGPCDVTDTTHPVFGRVGGGYGHV